MATIEKRGQFWRVKIRRAGLMAQTKTFDRQTTVRDHAPDLSLRTTLRSLLTEGPVCLLPVQKRSPSASHKIRQSGHTSGLINAC